MNEQPLVSVVIPTFNRAHMVGSVIWSVLGQTHRDLEVIVVNDGSKDHTRYLLGKIDDRRLQAVHQENQGLSAARNTGGSPRAGQIFGISGR